MNKKLLDLLILSPPDFLYRKSDEPMPMYGEERNIPYGALTVASYLVHHGLHAMVASMREFYQEKGSYIFFDRGTEKSEAIFIDKTNEILSNLLLRLCPAAIGLTINFAIHHRAAEIILDLISNLAPEMPLLVGGNHATHTAGHWLSRNNPVDFVILGEGEQTCLTLLESGLNPEGIPGVGLRQADGSIEIRPRPRLLSEEQLSIPANLSLMALPHWAPLSTQQHWTSLSRGCNWQCNFCTTPSMWGHQRYRRPHAVAAEIEQVTKIGVHDIFFAEDMLNPASRHYEGLAAALRRFPDCRFSTMTRMDLMDRVDLKRVLGAHIEHVYLGLESFSKDVVAAMGKKIRLRKDRDVHSALERLRSGGLKVTLFLLVGHPDSSFQEEMYSVRVCHDLASQGLITNILPFFFIPIPGTAAAEMQRLGKFRLLEPRMNHWTTWEPVVELLDPSGEVSYSAKEMRQVMDGYHDIWRTCGLGVYEDKGPCKPGLEK
ncbi:MAG TPA: radical SAM protein [Myxococcota bacterium]|nr:radical SAM protein [Myxococcota bacterium]